MFEPVGISIFI